MRRLLIPAAIIGLALGGFSAGGDRLPADTPLHVVVATANAAGPWLVAAFVAGALQRETRLGAVSAAMALLLAIVVYYAGIYVAGNEVADLARAGGAWLLVAAVVGPMLGAAGGYWARDGERSRVVPIAILAGALLAEAAFRLIQVEAWDGFDIARSDVQVGLVDVAVAALVPIVGLAAPHRLRGYAASVAIGAAGLAGFAAITEAVRTVIRG